MKNGRRPGLDIIRIAAALLVILCHSGDFFSLGLTINFISFAGVLAVELFFVMSGLLVGRSLVRAVTDTEPRSAFKRFYINRLFRVLPMYYLALALTAFVSGKSVPLSCLVFLQNFRWQDLSLLPQSWTLTIEAWFYFLVPPLFLLVVKALSSRISEKASVGAAVFLLCLLPFVLRVLAANAVPSLQWDDGIRKQIPLRLDSIGMGVALAALKEYYPEKYHKNAKNPIFLLLSVAGMWAMYRFYCDYLSVEDHFDSSALCKIFVFSVLPILSCMLVAFMENTTALNFLHGFQPVRWLSDLSYGVYLLHVLVFSLVSRFFVDARFSVSWLGFMGSVVLTILFAAVTYVLIELPMTKLRDRLLGIRIS